MLCQLKPPSACVRMTTPVGLAELGAQRALGLLQRRGVRRHARLGGVGGQPRAVMEGQREPGVEEDRAGRRFEQRRCFLV